MRAWDYHLPVGDLGALGGDAARRAGVGFASAAAIALVVRARWRSLELPLVAALVAIFWLVIPYQESRFLFAAFGVAAVALGARGRPAAAACSAGACWPSRSSDRCCSCRPRERLAAGSGRRWLAAVAHGRLATPAEPCRRPRRPRPWRQSGVAALVAVGCRQASRLPGARSAATRWTARSIARLGWSAPTCATCRVAYTGTNLAFPLAGQGLANRVVVREHRRARPTIACMTLRRAPRQPGATPPAPSRRPIAPAPTPTRWLANLRAAGAQVLFVAAMYPIVRRTIDADADGFPVERAWADARPDLFQLRYASPAARVYAHRAPVPP